jgi:hypothetical protein
MRIGPFEMERMQSRWMKRVEIHLQPAGRLARSREVPA